MSAVTTIRAGALVCGEHEIRPPGQSDWLPVERIEQRLEPSSGVPLGLFLHAGGRTFTTLRSTPWPVREVQP